MDLGRILKWIVIIALIWFVWKKVLPWIQDQKPASTATTSSPGGACISTTERASEVWGGGLRQFVNPPYDVGEWSRFQGNVNAVISAAEGACICSDPSCQTARSAMGDLRRLVSDMDGAIRSGGPPPSDAVQRQESIDNQITAARQQVSEGK